VIVSMIASMRGQRQTAYTPASDAAASNAAASSQAIAANGALGDSSDAAVQAAAALVGDWAPQGLTCDDKMTIQVSGSTLSLGSVGATPSTATIQSSPQAGVIVTQAANGNYTYTLHGDNQLSVVGPGLSMDMTKCPS